MKEINFFSGYLSKKYGKPLYRIPIDLPLSCPHRIKNSGKGCIFCPEDGARARHLKNNLNLKEQVKKGIDYVQRRYNAEPPYIAYFQSFTNTFADAEKLRELYSEALNEADFKSVIISTRPDCLPEDVMKLLEELNQKYELWIELGVQSSNEKTLEFINRGHKFEAVKEAAMKLSRKGIKCAAHVIIGLPGETRKDYIQTAKDLAALPFSGIKIHNLLVLKNTPLAKYYAEKQFPTLNEYEYAEELAEFLKHIPEDWLLMRLQADADKKDIIAPKWWMKKGQFLTCITERMKTDKQSFGIKTKDGSLTMYNPEYKQHFHTLAGAKTEALKKFLEPSEIEQTLEAGKNVDLLDIGFGLGYNAICAVSKAEKLEKGKLNAISFEKNKKPIEAALELQELDSLHKEILEALCKNSEWNGKFSSLHLITGDARKSAEETEQKFDCIFLDAFSPDKNPELWTFDFFRELKSLLKENGKILTYSSAFHVRGAFLRCGLYVGETKAFGRKKGGTIAAMKAVDIKKTLPKKEKDIILKTTAGTPLRDISLSCSRKVIEESKAKLIARLRKKGVPKWLKIQVADS